MSLERLLAFLAKHLVPLFSRRRWKRLASAINAYEEELKARTKKSTELASGLQTISGVLKRARHGLMEGDIEQGWRSLLNAQRLELLYLSEEELNAAGWAMRHEAHKLAGWRKGAVLGLLRSEQGSKQELDRVFRAAVIRDEHYHNEAYKDGLRRGTALLLGCILLAVVLTLLSMSYFGYFPWKPSDQPPGLLLRMAMIGLLGATISAITDWPKLDSSTKIPEAVSTFRVTLLRLLMGPASAVILYFVVQSEQLLPVIFKDINSNGYAILVVAFVAGFSERLVLRVVEAVAGKSYK